MSISPFMAGVSGFLKRRREVVDAQRLQQHELNKITQTATEEARVANLALPKFYVPGPGGTRQVVTYSDKTPLINNIKDAATSLGEADAYARMVVDGLNANSASWNDEQKDAYMTYLYGARDNLNNFIDVKGEDGSFFFRDSDNPIYKFQFPENAVSNGTSYNANLSEDGTSGPQVGIAIDENEKPFYNKAYEYAKSVLPKHSAYSSIDLEGAQDPAQIQHAQAESLIDRYGVHALALAADLPNLQYEVRGGTISQNTWQTIIGRANELYQNPDEIKLNAHQHEQRNKFIYNVIRSAGNDQDTMKNRSINATMKNPKEYRDLVEVDKEDAKAKYQAASMGLMSLGQLQNIVVQWQKNPENKGKEPPLGLFGKALGGVAQAFLSNPVGQVTAFVSDIKTKNGIDVIEGQEAFEERLTGYLSDSYIARVGKFRAVYDVWTEILAYQLASTLQGGTGGKTISDQDVLNIKRALGESLFQNGKFQLHRYKQIGNFLSTVKGMNYYLSKAQTIGDIDAAAAYSDYIFDYHLRKTFGFLNGDRNKDYGPNELSKAVIGMMSQTFDYADDAAKIPADQRVLNAAKAAQEGFDPENAEIVDGEIVSKKPENKNQEQIDSIKRQIEELKKNTKKDTNYYTKLGELEADLEELGAK